MQKLHPDKLPTITQGAIQQILRAYNLYDFSYEQINQGLENISLKVIAHGKAYVLRIYRQGKATPETISFEIAFQDYLRENGIPIPRIYPNTEGKELTSVTLDDAQWHLALLEFVEGQSITEHYTSRLTRELATLQARMHMLGMQYAEKKRAEERRWTELFDNLFHTKRAISLHPHIARFVERAQSFRAPIEPALPHGYNHLDLDLYGNVIVKDDAVRAIIDFDDLLYSPCIVCLGYTLWAVLFDDGEAAMRAYLGEYEKVRSLRPEERLALPSVLAFRNYVIGLVDLFLREKADTVQRMIELEKMIPTLSFSTEMTRKE